MTKSLCPGLGKIYAEVRLGLCPANLQDPEEKTIPVSFIGPQPYIKYKPTIGGSDFLVLMMLAQKFKFKPDFKQELAIDLTRKNGSTYGMVWTVRSVKTYAFGFR